MEIRRSYDRLISTMGFPIHIYIESGPCCFPHRYCSNGLCDGKETETDTQDCNTQACVCVFTKEKFEDVFGTEAPTDGPVGWVETDGEEGKSPEEPAVSIGDTVEIGAEVEIATESECGFW